MFCNYQNTIASLNMSVQYSMKEEPALSQIDHDTDNDVKIREVFTNDQVMAIMQSFPTVKVEQPIIPNKITEEIVFEEFLQTINIEDFESLSTSMPLTCAISPQTKPVFCHSPMTSIPKRNFCHHQPKKTTPTYKWVDDEQQGKCLQLHCGNPVSLKYRAFCSLHGGGRKCNVKGCTKGNQGGNLCIGHGGGKQCLTSGCLKAAQSLGLCKSHGGGLRCSVVNCGKSSQGNGKCRRHGGGKRCQHADCDSGAQRGLFCARHGGYRSCQFENCTRTDRGGGFCIQHRRDRLCTRRLCNRLRKENGLCVNHARELYYVDM